MLQEAYFQMGETHNRMQMCKSDNVFITGRFHGEKQYKNRLKRSRGRIWFWKELPEKCRKEYET